MPSKKHQPQSLQMRLWRLGYARLSFEHVHNACDYILNVPIPEDSPVYYPLTTAIYTLYARPFLRSNIIGRCTEQIVPKKYFELHRQNMLMRNQLVAHLDADTVISLYDVPGNSVRIRVTRDRFDIGAFQVKPQISNIVKIRELAELLVSRVDEQLQSLWENRNRELSKEMGEYIVDPKQNRFVDIPSPELPHW